MPAHPRVFIVRAARAEISSAVIATWQKYGLTDREVLAILNEIAAIAIEYGLREERHPDAPGKPADRL